MDIDTHLAASEPADAVTGQWQRHATDLVRYATLLVGPHDATDLVSAVFLRAVAHHATIEHERRYLVRAVTNAAIDQRRRARRRQAIELRVAIDDRHGEAPLDGAQLVDVRRAVAALSIRQRAVVYLTYWEGLDGNEAAAVLGIGSASVRRHLARAKDHLRKALA